jgi:hypothetical protein
MLPGDLAERGIRRDPGEEAIEIAKVRHVALDAGDVGADLLDRRR